MYNLSREPFFNQAFLGKTVVITGHTGFKGSWLSLWLKMLGARVIGISQDVPTSPSHFVAADLSSHLQDHRCNIQDLGDLKKLLLAEKPDFIFHLAAQALVNESYSNPVETMSTNIMGTVNILEVMRSLENPCAVIMITSDKCYDNVEWDWGYRENDKLGGKDPYSASKGAAELMIRTYVESYFSDGNVRVAIGRAGNVIGGGDWAADRLVPDSVRAWSIGESVMIRNPAATRPWQLVLEPLSGYLRLAALLSEKQNLHGEAFNFGPKSENNHTVRDLIVKMSQHWDNVKWKGDKSKVQKVYEAGLLKLNCDKALMNLHWEPVLDFSETVEMTMQWYRHFYEKEQHTVDLSMAQIERFCAKAKDQNQVWTRVDS